MSEIVEWLARRGREDRDRPACRFGETVLSFGALAGAVEALARGLQRVGVRPGDHVAVLLPNHPDHVVAFLALIRLGAVQVPGNIRLRTEGLRYLLAHAEARVVVADPALLPELGSALGALEGLDLVVWWGKGPAVGRARAVSWAEVWGGPGRLPPPPGGDPLVSITYTSGTTGPPKGVLVSEAMYRAAGEAAGLLADVRPGDVLLTWEPLYHIGGSQVILTVLRYGVTMALLPRFRASTFWAEARAQSATHVHHLGGLVGILMKQPPRPDDAWHSVRVSWGGGVPVTLWEAYERRFGLRVREGYGLTEGASFSTVNLEGRVGSVGRPLPAFEIRVVADDGRPLGPRQVGEIVQRARVPGLLTRGYYRDPAATAAALRDGWLHTGDLGYQDEDGFLYLVGRKTDSVRRRGEHVSAWEVEHVVQLHPAVAECAVIGVPSGLGAGDEEIKLVVRPAPGARLDPAALVAWCEARLAPFQVPRYVEVVEEFPRTPSERIRKDLLSRAVDGCWDRERARPVEPG